MWRPILRLHVPPRTDGPPAQHDPLAASDRILDVQDIQGISRAVCWVVEHCHPQIHVESTRSRQPCQCGPLAGAQGVADRDENMGGAGVRIDRGQGPDGQAGDAAVGQQIIEGGEGEAVVREHAGV